MDCQLCLIKCKRVGLFKKHLRSALHQQKFTEVFPEDVFPVTPCALPHIGHVNPFEQEKMTNPIVGLSMVSLCFCSEKKKSFYLCHICEEVFPLSQSEDHLSSGRHCINYFNYTDPNMLYYSWIPGTGLTSYFRRHKKIKIETEPGNLQILHLPKNLMSRLHSRNSYSKVMSTLSGNEKLFKQIKATQPGRMMIQTYLRHKKRSHPLVGLQHVVECVCAGEDERRHYLCTICKLTVTSNQIINHVLSFDHIYSYFKEWHPATLKSKECYTTGNSVLSLMMADLSRQAEKIHEGENNLKHVRLEPDEFTSVNFTSYTEALTKLESIKKISLTTNIKPGNKLVSLYPGFLGLWCQNCSCSFLSISQYVQHLFKGKHKKMLTKFGVDECFDTQNSAFFHSGLYSLITESFNRQTVPVGTSLLVTCASTQTKTENFCVCFACDEIVQESNIVQHMNSQKHLIYTLLHLNPWRLPFAWEKLPDGSELRSMALEEERKCATTDEIPLRVFDIPYEMHCNLYYADFTTVLERLPHRVLSNGVPKCFQNETFPLLGCHFMVKHVDVDKHVGHVCLLCQRRLSAEESFAHLFSQEHVKTFLVCFHPGSLDSSTNNTETLLDLATQASLIHQTSHVQTIVLHKRIWEPCNYSKLKFILERVKREESNENLEPLIVSRGRLVPKVTLRNVHKDNVGDNHQKNCADNEGHEKAVVKDEKANECMKITPKTEEPTVTEPSDETPETNESEDEDEDDEDKNKVKTETEEKLINTDHLMQPNDISVKSTRKRAHSMSENPDENMDHKATDAWCAEIDSKRQRLSREEESTEMEEDTASETDQESENQEAAAEEGEFFEFRCGKHDPVFFCDSCSLMLTETEASCHVSRHPKIKMMVVDVHEDVYSDLSKQSFGTAVQTLKTVKAQTQSGRELLSSASAPSFLKPGDTSVSFIQHEPVSGISNTEVVKMNISDNKSQTFTAATKMFQNPVAKTTEVTRASNKNDAKTHMKESAGASTSRGNDDASRLHPHPHENSAQMKNSLTTNINKNKRPAASHRTTTTTTSEHKRPNNEPSQSSTTNKPSVGVIYLIKAKCGEKRQVYCELCKVKLPGSRHVAEEMHQYNYLKKVCPNWEAKPSEMESKFKKAIIQLSESEKDIKPRKEIEVTSEVYKELAALPPVKAIEKLNKMIMQKHPRTMSISSPCEVSSSDDANNRPEQNKKQNHPLAQVPESHMVQPNTAEHPAGTSRGTADAKEPSGISLATGVKTQDSSHLSRFIKVMGVESKPIVGLKYVWECRGITVNTFYLCEICEERLFLKAIIEHMVSHDHQVRYLTKMQKQFLWPFDQTDLLPPMKLTVFNVIIKMLSMRESFNKEDAQVMLLKPELYESVHRSPASEALNMVKRIKQKQESDCPAMTKHTEMWWTETERPEQKTHKEWPINKKPHVEVSAAQSDKETSVNWFNPKPDSAVESCSNIFSPNTELQNPTDVRPHPAEESSFSTSHQASVSQILSSSHMGRNFPTRKMSADTSAETLDLMDIDEPSSESSESPPLLSPLDKEPESDQQKTQADFKLFTKLASLLRGKMMKTTESVNSATSSSSDGVESRVVVDTMVTTTADTQPQQKAPEDEASPSTSSYAAGQTDNITDDQFPINTIVTSRRTNTNHALVESYTVNTQASFPIVPLLNQSIIPAAPYGQMLSVTGQYPGYHPPDYSTTISNVYTNQVYQQQWMNMFVVPSYGGGFTAVIPPVGFSQGTPQQTVNLLLPMDDVAK